MTCHLLMCLPGDTAHMHYTTRLTQTVMILIGIFGSLPPVIALIQFHYLCKVSKSRTGHFYVHHC